MNVTDPDVKREASKKYPLEKEPPPYKPGTATGFTNAQQAALYNSRKARRQRLGVVPQPPLP